MKQEYKIPADKLAKAKGWEVGISKPTSNGGRMLLLNNNVRLVVGGEVDAEGNITGGRLVEGGIFFSTVEEKLELLNKLSVEGKISEDFLTNFTKRIGSSGADRIVEAKFERYQK